MNQENDNKQVDNTAEMGENGREGYVPVSNYQSKATDKPQRPRIHTQRAYSSEHGRAESEGFRPEGFGSGLQQGTQRPYRPRFNNQGQGLVVKKRSRVDPALMENVEYDAEGKELSRSYEPA